MSYQWHACIQLTLWNTFIIPPWLQTPQYDVIKWKHFPRNWPSVRGIHRSSVNSPHEGQWRGALMFSLICGSINAWVNNRETGDLRRHHAHYDVIEMHYHSGGRFVSYAWNGANMGPIWGRQDPGRPHVGPMNFAIWRASRCCVIHTDWRVQLWWISSNCYEVSKKSKHLPFIMFMSIHKLIRQVTDIMCNQYIALMITLAKGWGWYHDFSCTCW